MATKTFSGRVDERSLAFADSLSKKEYGISFGQYCGTVLLDAIERTGRMPDFEVAPFSCKKTAAASYIKSFSSKAVNPAIGKLSDNGIKELIGSRYDA